MAEREQWTIWLSAAREQPRRGDLMSNDVTILTLDSGQKVRAMGSMEIVASENNVARATTGWQSIDDPGTSAERWVRADRVVLIEADEDGEA